ncbi:MAG: nucleoside kinase [Candidatus Ornithospirochaeta sp.]|nr:nucleoside kinase [Candidatus Ornithospirochaeta sp.]
MDRITISLEGKRTDIARNTGIESLFEPSMLRGYSSDTIVAATVNGVIRRLDHPAEENSEINPVRLFSPLGKRVYRKTLCFLLSYASSVIYPDRSLIIGHSLGDGFYFHYKDQEAIDASRLRKAMEKAIREDRKVSLTTLPHGAALEYLRSHSMEETAKLLESRNDSSYSFSALDGYLELETEPIVPNLGILEVWDLMEYRDGILLRYPQSRSYDRIRPFEDNPKLFDVFCQNKNMGKRLELESLGALNLKQRDGDIQRAIRLEEESQRNRIAEIAERIASKGSVKAVFIAGPSSSGKTTFSLKISEQLILRGLRPIKISLDDYYLPPDQVPLDEDGKADFEVMEALDLKCLREQIGSLIMGRDVHLASWDFAEKKRTFSEKACRMDDSSVLVIEGIHGLNPALLPDLGEDMKFRIYISALTQLNLDTRSRISTTDNRILRRMIRDNRTRGLDAVETLTRWPSVERGEKNHIFPLQNMADEMINSALSYEIGVLAPFAIPLLRSVGREHGDAYTNARRLLSFLELVYPIQSSLVPEDSIIREFIGGSVFSVT